MEEMMKKVIVVLLFLLLISSGGDIFAIEPVAMPAFTVQSMDNTPVQSDQLSQESRWVLIYLPTDCRYCDDILHTLEVSQNPPLSRRVVIVAVGGTPENISALIGPREKIASLRWYADPDWSAYKTLPISGTPFVFGIREGIIEWGIAGIPWDSKTMRSVLLDWINY